MRATNLDDSPEVSPSEVGSQNDLVPLDPDHPGFRDPKYRERRNTIARIALEHREGDPVPSAPYTEEEHAVWRTVWDHLEPLHERFASRECLECERILGLDRNRIPQLAEVNLGLARTSGYQMQPVAGLVTERTFLSRLARDVFLSTQYIRHASTPLYTPEPDVVHELVGHAATLAHQGFARLSRAFGGAAQRVPEEHVTRIARVYWYTLEFGVVREGGELRAYGAGLLSSYGELGRFAAEARMHPLDHEKMAASPYDPTRYQDDLFVAESFPALVSSTMEWLAGLPSR